MADDTAECPNCKGRMRCEVRRDYCSKCRYEFYYGDAHATGDAQLSRLVNPGEVGLGMSDEEFARIVHYENERAKRQEAGRRSGKEELPPGWEFDDQAFLNGY